MDEFVQLDYEIHDCSSYSGIYVPSNILVNKPGDQTSRWSSENNNPPQYITLKLKRPAILRTITFGKYEKTHVCNLKRFKVLAGLHETSMIEILDSGLRNDNQSETFFVKYRLESNPLPLQFVRIVPQHSWGPSFNYSVWYVRLCGVDRPELVSPHLDWFNSYREREAIRLCLKHFRQQNYSEAFSSLQKRTCVPLEHERLALLHHSLVECGQFEAVERQLEEAAAAGLFDEHVGRRSYRADWRPIEPGGERPRPGMRGGHQMCYDSNTETIYLFGGWDGTRDLADLWAYSVRQSVWSLLSSDTTAEGGPSARSCHKMCIDSERQHMFTLGRYVDSSQRVPENLKSDFYMYDIASGRWTLITDDTCSVGGPCLVFDHQMAFDPVSHCVYVFGGKELTCTASSLDDRSGALNSVEPVFSGLFSYHVPTSTWKELRVDVARRPVGSDAATASHEFYLKSRVSHCMLLDHRARLLYIFAGQRHKEYLSDFFTYHLETGRVEVICDRGAAASATNFGHIHTEVPAVGTTQRATIDPQLGEIHVLSGLSKDKDKRDDHLRNSFWIYNIKESNWSCIYRNRPEGDSQSHAPEPCPRFAHQLVFDHINKVFYLFGGNPGRKSSPKMRLDDFWRLQLLRPTATQLLTKCRQLVRMQRYAEMARVDRVAALNYLQTSVSQVVDHECVTERRRFQLLTGALFAEMTPTESESTEGGEITSASSAPASGEVERLERSALFDQLSLFFPVAMSQPADNLLDLIHVQM